MSRRGKNNQTGSTLHFCSNKALMLQSFFSSIRSFILVTTLLIWVPVIGAPDIVLAQETSDDNGMEEALSGFDEEDSGIEDALSGFDEEKILSTLRKPKHYLKKRTGAAFTVTQE